MAYFRPYLVARRKDPNSLPFTGRLARRYLGPSSSASSQRISDAHGAAPSLPLSGVRPSVLFLVAGTIAPGCDSR